MKITLINHSDTVGGASVVTFRLMEALRAEGVDARMIVAKKSSDSPYVEQFEPSSRIPFLKEHLRIFTHNGFSRKRLFQVSIASDGLPLSRHPFVKNADAVILNWVNQGTLSFGEIKKIAKEKPTFWTMHDQWNFTSICHHTGGCDRFKTHCQRCHYLGWMESDRDLSYKVFEKKEKLYNSVEITFVAVSKWLASRGATAALFSGKKVVVIPNAFPVQRYALLPKFTKKELSLPEDKKIIVFCAARIDDPGKGLNDAVDLMNGIASTHGDSVCAVFVGACRDPRVLESLKIRHVEIGPVKDPDVIHSIMSHAAVVMSTSPFETLSTTMIEAQAAGATPVCYTHDGRGDIVTDRVNGYSLKDRNDVDSLREALDRPIAKDVLRAAVERYRASLVARQYINLLKEKI